ncbi:hypothetical protein ACJ41O_001776 [Fusarium nematophilum]
MQFSHFEPPVRHAVLSISSLYEEFARGSRITRQICGSTFAIGHYNAAIRQINSSGDEQFILLVCVLFVCIEYLQGDIDAALRHCRHGIMILNESRCCPGWAREHLVPIFRRLSLIPFFFGGAPSMRLPRLISFDADIATEFTSIAEAQSLIDDLMFRAMECVLGGLDDQRSSLVTLLDQWESRAKSLEDNIPTSSTTDRYAMYGMRIKHKVARIHLHKPHEATEMWFDQHLDTFRSAVDVAGKASMLWRTARQEHMPDSSFTFEMSFLPLLFFVTIKCRRLETRLEALSYLAQLGPAKEGLFDVGTMYRVARRLIELEHGMSLDDDETDYDDNMQSVRRYADEPLPAEEKRFFAVPVKHELEVISAEDGRVHYERQVHFLQRNRKGQVVAREEYISDDKPSRCRIQIPPMRCARRM